MGLQPQHAINLLGVRTGWGSNLGVRKGRTPKYDSMVEEVLWQI
jgi:hypothetical protein